MGSLAGLMGGRRTLEPGRGEGGQVSEQVERREGVGRLWADSVH